MNPISLLYLAVALIDYTVKAVVSFRETDQGRAEWLDVETRYNEAMSYETEADLSREEAQTLRRNQRPNDAGTTRINLNS